MADQGINWGKALGNTLKIAAIGAAVVAGVSLLPQGMQLASDALQSMAGNATDGTLITASNALESGAHSLSSAYVDAINWGGQYLGTSIDPSDILNKAGVGAATAQNAAETVFTNWDTYKEFASLSAQNAGTAASGLWDFAKDHKLSIGAAAGATGLLAYQLGKSGKGQSGGSRPTVGAYTASYNAREAARARMAALGAPTARA